MGRIPTTDLVNKIFAFCEAYSGIKFFPYQVQPSKRIIRSLLVNDGDEITALQSRQSGKSEVVSTTVGGLMLILPTLANMPMFANDTRLQPYRNGLMVGIFAPALHQAQISFNRMKTRMTSRSAQAVMSDPDIMLGFDTNNGQTISISNGSFVTSMSASEGSNIEGQSYHLIIVDESQDVSNFKYSKSISPMGAFYNATKVLIGTPTTSKGFFFHAIQRNIRTYEESEGRIRNHFQYDYKVVLKYNPKYEKYIEGEKRRLGEDSDEFRMSYALEWVLERGMFITEGAFERLMDDDLDFVHGDMRATHVVGIDLGKTSDSTIVCVMEVDFETPTIIEDSDNLDIQDFVAYDKTVKSFLEIQGDDYDSQYYQIMDFISHFNVTRVVVDGTGVGTAFGDRLMANLRCEVIPYVLNRPSKSELYKRFDGEIRGGRIHIPGSPEARETREHKSMTKQFVDLQKSYSGQYMVVAHPEERGAHDDYPDSMALATWGATGEGVSVPVTEKHPKEELRQMNKQFYTRRNSLTARRR